MKITVVTATYNSARTLRDTLESVLSQTYGDMEYILTDGGSTDGTLDLVREYEPRFQGRMRWVSEPDGGIYDAMNKGIRMATGEVVGLLNSDDVFCDAHVLEDIAACFDARQVDCVYGNLLFCRDNDLDRIVRIWKGSPYSEGAFMRGWHPAHPTFYARRTCYEQYGYYDTGVRVSADFDLMLRFLDIHKVSNAYLDRFIVKMRMGGESTGNLRLIVTGNRNILRAMRKNGYPAGLPFLMRRLLPKVWNRLKTPFVYKKYLTSRDGSRRDG